eukprot:1140422-Pelagomonas_calceolata.AAC.6
MAKHEFTVHSTATPADTNWPAGMNVRLAPSKKYLIKRGRSTDQDCCLPVQPALFSLNRRSSRALAKFHSFFLISQHERPGHITDTPFIC